MDTIITDISSSKEPQPNLWQILLKFVSIVNNLDWVRWSVSVGAMPNLHWYCYTFLERIFNCFADFATNFGNGNIMSESHPITKLNTKALVGALMVMKAFCDQINLHQATMLPIIISQSVVASYNISPWNNTQICGWPLGGNWDPIPSLVWNNAGKISVTLLLLLMRPTTPIPPIVRSRKSLKEA